MTASAARFREPAIAAGLLAMLSVSALLWVQHQGWTLYYGDAEAHLDIARRVLDSRTPGWEQIGTAWLPLPHLLIIPFVMRDGLWYSGLGGAIPSSIAFILAGVFLFLAVRRALPVSAAAWAALACFALNPNLLYLQATPMTEPLFAATLAALLYFTVAFKDSLGLGYALFAGLAGLAASQTRYEGWFLIPFVTLFFLLCGGRKRYTAAMLFTAIASAGPLLWLAHNHYYFGRALEFYDGPFSAKVIDAVAPGMTPNPGDHDWGKAALYFGAAAKACAGSALLLVAACGLGVALWKRVWWPLALLALPPVFYVVSMYSSGRPVFVPGLWPFSYYNTRYGLALLPLAAFATGTLVLLVSARWRPVAAALIALLAISPWIARPRPDNWICWKESQVNSVARRAWTHQAAGFLAHHYRAGTGIFGPFAHDLDGIYREARIPFREVLQEGNHPAWEAALGRPDLFLHEEWAVVTAGDAADKAVRRTGKGDSGYRKCDEIAIKNAPKVVIYRRN